VTESPQRDWIEIGATVLLALAAAAAAWSSYQAAPWNGEQAKTSSAVNKARIDGARGMSTRLTGSGARKALLLVGGSGSRGAVAWIATSPVSVSI
jgi:hypothetical protein